MNSTLPTRWQEILRREAAENVGNVLAQAQEQAPRHQVPRWTVPALAIGLASFSLFNMTGGTEAKGRGTVPFDRSTVVSTRTAGLGASAEDLAPRPAPSSSPLDALVPVAVRPSPSPDALAVLDRRPPAPPRRERTRGACPECDARREAMRRAAELEAQEQARAAQPEPSPTSTPKPPPLIVNVGTRVEAVLTDPVVTGIALAPATAKLVKDFYVADRIAIPAGTLLAGEAFSTQDDDRAQVVFTAIVKDGKTVQFEGWALQQGEAGVRGKVVRKASRAKKGAGSILGAAASALTFGAAGAVGGPEGAALASLGNTAAGDMVGVGRDWRRSDKVVRIEAGAPVTIYVRRDVTLE
jgi:type IV secretory pathway VirB10-like protein